MKKERRKVSVLKSTCFSRFSFFYFSSSCDRLLLLLFTTCHRHITSFISCNVFVFFVVRFSSSEDHFKTKAETCHPIRSSGTQPKFNLSFFLMLRISSYSLNIELSHISLQFQLNSINSCTWELELRLQLKRDVWIQAVLYEWCCADVRRRRQEECARQPLINRNR